jgi:hypothetical protein
MASSTGRPVALDAERDFSTLALVLALISVPGSILTWDWLPGGGFVWGLPFAVAAVALGMTSRRVGGAKSIAAIVIGGAMLAMVVVWTIVDLLA